MEAERVERIVVALRRAAEHERLLTYQRFHAMFGAGDPLTARYDALERAIASLGAEPCPGAKGDWRLL